MTIPSDNYTATTTYESGLPAATTNNAVAAAELNPPPLHAGVHLQYKACVGWCWWEHVLNTCCMYRVDQKMAQFLYALTLPNINRFSKFFHCQNQEKICK